MWLARAVKKDNLYRGQERCWHKMINKDIFFCAVLFAGTICLEEIIFCKSRGTVVNGDALTAGRNSRLRGDRKTQSRTSISSRDKCLVFSNIIINFFHGRVRICRSGH